MPILRRVQHGYRRLRSLAARESPAALPRRTALRLNVPDPFGGDVPLLRAEFTLSRGRGGESARLQGYVDGRLSLPAAPPVSPRPDPALRPAQPRAAAAYWLRRGLKRLPQTPLAPLLDRRARGWVDVQASRAPLAAGATALVPERLRELCGDLPPDRSGKPRAAVWRAPLPGPRRGLAQLAVLQADNQDLPASARAGAFSVSASVATVVEDQGDESDERG